MCGDPEMGNAGAGMAGRLGLIDLPPQQSHVKRTLPPSLSGFPGEAEIRYYVKVTVQRPSIWKENKRSAIGFKFMPIEPPRPPLTSAEAFARRAHAFQPGLFQLQKKRGLFGKSPRQLSNEPPSVLVDARLPSPSILVCRDPLPLRIIIKRQNASPEQLFLLGLEVNLVGATDVRAQNVIRQEISTFPVLTLRGLSAPIGKEGDPTGTETLLDANLWNQVALPPTVTPSFHICNLTRTYSLHLRITLGYGFPGEISPQTQVIPLVFPVEVYSGIRPPPELVAAATQRPVPVSSQTSPPLVPPRAGAPPPLVDPLYPPQMGTAHADLMGDAPPSYEDAMAEDIGPLDGRRVYSGVTDENAPSEVDDRGKGRGAVPGYSVNDPNGGAGPSRGGGGAVV